MNGKTKNKPLPVFKTDAEAEKFVSDSDLTEYDLSGGKETHFEFEAKTKQINIRMPEGLISAVKKKAKSRGIPYQRFIRETLERALR